MVANPLLLTSRALDVRCLRGDINAILSHYSDCSGIQAIGFQSSRSNFKLISNWQFGSVSTNPTTPPFASGTSYRYARTARAFLVAACHFKQVVAELCFDWALQCVDVGTEYDLIEFFYHHAWAKLAKISTLRLGRAA